MLAARSLQKLITLLRSKSTGVISRRRRARRGEEDRITIFGDRNRDRFISSAAPRRDRPSARCPFRISLAPFRFISSLSSRNKDAARRGHPSWMRGSALGTRDGPLIFGARALGRAIETLFTDAGNGGRESAIQRARLWSIDSQRAAARAGRRPGVSRSIRRRTRAECARGHLSDQRAFCPIADFL